MKVFWHEYERGEPITMAFPGPIDAFCQHSSPHVISQQRPTLKTGKRQFVDIARVVIVADSFALRWWPSHAGHFTPNRHCWTSQQWHPLVAKGTPEMVARTEGSITAGFLQPLLIEQPQEEEPEEELAN
ncbi:MAG: hypothetical protein ABSG68_17140 [Thermoguttaceae bacterium]|jgi:hypothetical protein